MQASGRTVMARIRDGIFSMISSFSNCSRTSSAFPAVGAARYRRNKKNRCATRSALPHISRLAQCPSNSGNPLVYRSRPQRTEVVPFGLAGKQNNQPRQSEKRAARESRHIG